LSDLPDYARVLYTGVKNAWQVSENLDATHGYNVYIWIPTETFTVDIVKIWLFAEKYRTSDASGVSEEAITGRTLSVAIFDPNGILLQDFGVVTTGEDAVILDLSWYFSTLKTGYYILALSASGRLTARVLIYELCKMYAQY